MIPLLLLHGALGDRAQLSPLAQLLAESYDVHAIELEGFEQVRVPLIATLTRDFLDAAFLTSTPRPA